MYVVILGKIYKLTTPSPAAVQKFGTSHVQIWGLGGGGGGRRLRENANPGGHSPESIE
jgi:hypothetical protein